MKTTRATKSEIKAATLRIAELTRERDEEQTRKLGPAAVRCVEQSLEAERIKLAGMVAA